MTLAFVPRGVFTALVTPFTDAGEIDIPAFEKLARFQVDSGVTGLVPCGTTGESPTLAWEEHDTLTKLSAKAAGDRASVLAGTGSNNTSEAVDATASARKLGASAALVVDCYYNGPSSLELRTEYYERILAGVPELPIVPYIIPGRSGCALAAADLAILHQRDPERVPAVKQATGDFNRMREDRALAGPSFAVLAGDEDMVLRMMRDDAIASSGVISVMSNVAPAALVSLIAAEQAGDRAKADALNQALSPLFGLVTVFSPAVRTLPNGTRVELTEKYRNPSPVKAIMAALGLIGPMARAPLGKLSAEALAICRSALRAVHAHDRSILAPLEEAFGIRVDERIADDRVWTSLQR